MKTLREAFEILREVKLQYVVLRDYRDLPSRIAGPIRILTVDVDAFVRLLDLIKIGRSVYRLELAHTNVEFILYQRGRVFPDRFESQLLHHSHYHNDIVSVPDQRHDLLARLWFWLYYDGKFIGNKDDEQAVRNYLNDHVGMPIRSAGSAMGLANLTPATTQVPALPEENQQSVQK